MLQTRQFGSLVRHYRIAAGMTQEELAERAGLSSRGISDIERGIRRAPYKDTVTHLAKALQLSPKDEALFMGAAGRGDMFGRSMPRALQTMFVTETMSLPLAGRTDQLELLQRQLCSEGTSLILLAGEPGIGKSRLLREISAHAAAAGWAVLAGGCYWRGGQEPYTPFLEALAQHLFHQPPARQRRDLQGCSWLTYLLPELVDLDGVTPPPGNVPVAHERRLMFKAVRRFLANVSGPSGTLLVLDDLQWAGSDTFTLLVSLLRSESAVPLHIVGAYRDSELTPSDPLAVMLADLAPTGLLTQIQLPPLTPEDAAFLLDRLMISHEELFKGEPHLRQQMLVRAGGVPFFLVSCAQALTALDPETATEASLHEIPWNVAQSIRQRVAQLPETARESLNIAAVTGRVVSDRLLVCVLSKPEDQIVYALEVAQQARLFMETGDGNYQFAHDLIGEVVAKDLSLSRRKSLHRRVAEVLEVQPGVLPVATLAYHYGHAGDQEKTIFYLDRAGDRAQEMRAYTEAETSYRELVSRLEALGRTMELLAAREKLGSILVTAARYGAALDVLASAEEVARVGGNWDVLGRILTLMGQAHARQGTAQEGIALIGSMISDVGTGKVSAGTLAALLVTEAQLYAFVGQYYDQLSSASRGAACAREADDNSLLSQAELERAGALYSLGCLEDALAVREHMLPVVESASDLLTLSTALNDVAQQYENLGDFAASRPYMERALQAAEQLGDPVQCALLTCNCGQSAFYRGDWREARRYHEQAVAIMSRLESSHISAYPFGGLGLLSLAEGCHDVGMTLLRRLEASAEGSGDLGTLRYARCALAECDLLDGHPGPVVASLTPLLDRPGQEEAGVIKLLPLLAWAHMLLEDGERAGVLAEQAVTRAARLRRLQPDGLRARALVAMKEGLWAQAERMLDAALVLCQAMAYPYGEVKTRYTYGVLFLSKQEVSQACQHLKAALIICDRLGEHLYARHIESMLAECLAQTPADLSSHDGLRNRMPRYQT